MGFSRKLARRKNVNATTTRECRFLVLGVECRGNGTAANVHYPQTAAVSGTAAATGDDHSG
jgi:hypothetical protein